MKTKVTTKKGTKVTFEINNNAVAEITIHRVKTFKKPALSINDGVVIVGRMKGQKIGLGFDTENQKKIQSFINELDKSRKQKKEARKEKERQEFQEKHKEAFQKAKETGKRQEVSQYSYETSGSYVQIVTEVTYALPNGSTKTVKNQKH